jgi:hypothetical protein
MSNFLGLNFFSFEVEQSTTYRRVDMRINSDEAWLPGTVGK